MQVAEEERFLDLGGEVQQVGDLGHAGAGYAELPGGFGSVWQRAIVRCLRSTTERGIPVDAQVDVAL